MDRWIDIVQNYIVKHSDRVKKTTKPLRDHFGINYFTYHRIDSEGNYSVLVDRPDFAELYVENKLYTQDAFHDLPNQFQSGICTIESHMSLKPLNSVVSADTGVMLITKSDEAAYFYGFCASKKTSPISNLAHNFSQVLYSFASHFENELGDILSTMQSEQFAICKQARAKTPIIPEITTNTLSAYYNDLGMKSEVELASRLTKRERECLLLLIEGMCAKATAKRLGIKRRTVESYFDTIKDKLSCYNKQEVFFLAKKLHALGLLSTCT